MPGELDIRFGEIAVDDTGGVITAVLDAASFRTRNDRRDRDVRSPKFLDVEQHPDILFTGRWAGPGAPLRGHLTVRDVAAEQEVEILEIDGDTTFRARARVDRRAFPSARPGARSGVGWTSSWRSCCRGREAALPSGRGLPRVRPAGAAPRARRVRVGGHAGPRGSAPRPGRPARRLHGPDLERRRVARGRPGHRGAPRRAAARAGRRGSPVHAGCPAALLQVPASALRDQRVPLAELHRRITHEARLPDAESPADALMLLGGVAARLPGRPDHSAPALADTLGAGAAVGAAADTLGCTTRTLHRHCLAAFGYGPAVLRRVLRFRRATDLLHAGVAPAEVAALAGYADQPHLSREVRAMAGMAPRQLASGANRSTPLPSGSSTTA